MTSNDEREERAERAPQSRPRTGADVGETNGHDLPSTVPGAHVPSPVDKPRWSRRRSFAVGVGTFFAAAVATAGITTASSHTSSSAATGTSAAGGQPDAQGANDLSSNGRFAAPPRNHAGFGVGGALHGQFVVADGNGGYVTAEIQTGQVSAASATSITVVSDDGYTRSYTVGSSTNVGGTSNQVVVPGDTVNVQATVSGQTASATQIIDGGGQQSGTQPGTGTTAS